MEPDQELNAVLRAIDHARGEPEVLGVITEHSIAQFAYATARLSK